MTVWRDLSEEEAARWPMARLRGALAIMTACAAALSLMALAALSYGLHLFGPRSLIPGLLAGLGAPLSPAARVGALYMTVSLLLTLWGVVFLVMTVMRARATPVVASALFGLHYLIGIAAAAGTQLIIGGGSATPRAIATALAGNSPAWLGGLMLTVGFSAYLLGGVRPNAYYRRRIALPPQLLLAQRSA